MEAAIWSRLLVGKTASSVSSQPTEHTVEEREEDEAAATKEERKKERELKLFLFNLYSPSTAIYHFFLPSIFCLSTKHGQPSLADSKERAKVKLEIIVNQTATVHLTFVLARIHDTDEPQERNTQVQLPCS